MLASPLMTSLQQPHLMTFNPSSEQSAVPQNPFTPSPPDQQLMSFNPSSDPSTVSQNPFAPTSGISESTGNASQDSSLHAFLAMKGLQKYTQHFTQLGFCSPKDFQELNANDILELGQTLGLNFVDQKKLRNMIQGYGSF